MLHEHSAQYCQYPHGVCGCGCGMQLKLITSTWRKMKNTNIITNRMKCAKYQKWEIKMWAYCLTRRRRLYAEIFSFECIFRNRSIRWIMISYIAVRSRTAAVEQLCKHNIYIRDRHVQCSWNAERHTISRNQIFQIIYWSHISEDNNRKILHWGKFRAAFSSGDAIFDWIINNYYFQHLLNLRAAGNDGCGNALQWSALNINPMQSKTTVSVGRRIKSREMRVQKPPPPPAPP